MGGRLHGQPPSSTQRREGGNGVSRSGSAGFANAAVPAPREDTSARPADGAASKEARKKVERAYPLELEGRLDDPLSRWLWLVKWLLAIPHLVLLVLLWIAFVLLTVVAFFSILFTGRYPRDIFDFNTGVLRWTWRVQFYATSAIGTDRYPPFTLAAAPDYPATLTVEFPMRLSRKLVLVKWWLLALPHYVIVMFLFGGGVIFHLAGGLVGVLVLVAGVVLLFTGSYPRSIFDLVLGFDRWTWRVAAYAALMTDRYPPFRLDPGEREPVPVPGAQVPATSSLGEMS